MFGVPEFSSNRPNARLQTVQPHTPVEEFDQLMLKLLDPNVDSDNEKRK